MKKGNQFYLEIQLYDEELLDISSVSKVQFNIGTLTSDVANTQCTLVYLYTKTTD